MATRRVKVPVKLSDLIDDRSPSELADRAAGLLYLLGAATVVVGPKITGSDPPQRGPSTEAKVEHLRSLGIADDWILWKPQGEEDPAALPVLTSLSMLVDVVMTAPLLNMVGGVVSASDMLVNCVFTSPAITQASNGTLITDNLSVQSIISNPDLLDQAALSLQTENLVVSVFMDSPSVILVGGVLVAEDIAVPTTMTVPAISLAANAQIASDNMTVSTTMEVPAITQVSNGTLAATSMTVASTMTNPPITPNTPTTGKIVIIGEGYDEGTYSPFDGDYPAGTVFSCHVMMYSGAGVALFINGSIAASAPVNQWLDYSFTIAAGATYNISFDYAP